MSEQRQEWIVDALIQAVFYKISAYDGCYLALAHRLSLPLITADAKLAKIVVEPGRIRLLQ